MKRQPSVPFPYRKWRRLAATSIAAALLVSLSATAPANAFDLSKIRDQRSGVSIPIVDGQVVVKLEPGIDRRQAADLASAFGLRVRRVIDSSTYLIEVPPAGTLAASLRQRGFAYRADLDRVQNAIAAIRADGRVRFAEPNAVMHSKGFTPNDWKYPEQWHFFETDLEGAWAIEWGQEEVKIAVLDTGIRWGLWTWLAFQNPIADPWDFVDNDDTPDDLNGHGTHTAGIIGVRSNNYFGLAGMAPETTLMPVRVLDAEGIGSLDALLAGLDWAIQKGADVVNMSLSFPPGFDPGQTLLDKIQEAHAAGVVLVASTGNDGVGVVAYPAAYNEVIAVGALDKFQQRADYSNFGAGLDVMAPGGMPEDEDGDGDVDGILSLSFDPEDPFRSLGYWYGVGTSQAAPQVAALAALLKSHGINDNDTIASLVAAGCRYIDGSGADCATGSAWDVDDNTWADRTSCWNPETGYGLIDPYASLDELVTLGDSVATALGGEIEDYAGIPIIYPSEFFGAVLDLPEGLLLILEDDTGLFAFIDSGCDSRDFAAEAEDDSTFESVCDIAQYELLGWTLEELLTQDGGLIQFISDNGGLVGFLNGNGGFIGQLNGNGGLIGFMDSNGGLIAQISNNGYMVGMTDVEGTRVNGLRQSDVGVVVATRGAFDEQ